MAYFTIMAELRGCYSDNDSAGIIRADTRRALKEALQYEARDLRDAGAIGLSQRAIAWLANAAWKARRNGSPYPFVAPFRYPSQGGYCMGLMVYNSTRADYIAAQESWV